LVETTGDAARNQENIARLGTEVLPRLRAVQGLGTDIPDPGMLGTSERYQGRSQER
jgi:hypothetical protein